MNRAKHEAIVLRSVKYGEHDVMLTLLTKDTGKKSAVAKGAQSPKSKYIASSQLFAMSEFVLSESASGFSYVTSADLINGFFNVSKSLDKLASSSYCVEAADLMLTEDDGEEIFFRLVAYTLKLIAECDDASVFTIIICYIVKLLAISGIAPRFSECAVCAAEKSRYYFDYESGGMICASCAEPHKRQHAVSAKEAQYMQMLGGIDMTRLPDIAPLEKSESIYLLKILDGYITYSFGRKLKSFALLSEI